MRLLVVEDESLLRQQLEQGLVKEGYVVDGAEDGRNGLYFATEFDYDAAIIDLDPKSPQRRDPHFCFL